MSAPSDDVSARSLTIATPSDATDTPSPDVSSVFPHVAGLQPHAAAPSDEMSRPFPMHDAPFPHTTTRADDVSTPFPDTDTPNPAPTTLNPRFPATRRGVETAVIISHDEYTRITAARSDRRPSIAQYLLGGPTVDGGEAFERIALRPRGRA